MITRRNYILISFIMAVILFMFIASSVAAVKLNKYDKNKYENQIKETDCIPYNCMSDENISYNEGLSDSKRNQAVYIGDITDKKTGNVVRQWADYTKRGLRAYKNISEYIIDTDKLPDIVLIDSVYIDFESQTDNIEAIIKAGVNVIFCNLPDFSIIKENEQLRKILGITIAHKENEELLGIKLFKGFMLGGERNYIEKDIEDLKQQDLDLNVPWYVTKTAAKVYMVGVPLNEEERELDNEVYPSLIWRTSAQESNVFVVNGNFLSDNGGIGILYGITSQLKNDEIYPIVNAQNVNILNYPGLISENNEKLQEEYCMDSIAVFRDYVMPSLISLRNRLGIKVTCYISPKLDYSKNDEMSEELALYYINAISREEGELALSLYRKDIGPLSYKLDTDYVFFKKNLPNYNFSAAALSNNVYSSIANMLNRSIMTNVRTMLVNYNSNDPVFSIIDGYLCQQTINSGFSHTYSEDFRELSLQTALGYSNVTVDLSDVIYPREGDAQLGILLKRFTSYLSTYWNSFETFDKTTITESYIRTRDFLQMDYHVQYFDNKVEVNIKNMPQGRSLWFILRTDKSGIADSIGCECSLIEDGVYLIKAEKENITINFKSDAPLPYTK